jgi:hypothetical protein
MSSRPSFKVQLLPRILYAKIAQSRHVRYLSRDALAGAFKEKTDVQFLNLILNRKKLLRRENESETRQICRDALTHTNLHSVCCRHVSLLW